MPVRHSGAALLMSLPVFAWLFYWSAFWHHRWGGSGRRGCIPKLQQKTSFSPSRSPSVIWALIYVLLWQRLTSFLTGSAQTGTLGGKQQKAGFTEQMSTMKGSMCAPFLSPPVASLTWASHLSPHRLFPSFIHLPLPNPPPHTPTPSCISSVLEMTSEVVPECWGPEGTPLLSMQVRSCECTCAGSERGALCLLWWQNTICRQRSLMHSP